MAGRVRSVGAIATIYDVEALPGHTPLALPPEADSTTIAISPERLADLGSQVRRALGVVPSRSAEDRRAPWAAVLAELERLGVRTDADTLLGLDFDFVPDKELRAALDAGGPG
jgi:hypothetical protein